MQLCPIIKDMMGEDDDFTSNQKRDKLTGEILARLTHLQQFVQGGHGSENFNYQASKKDMDGNLPIETSLYEEVRTLKTFTKSIMRTLGVVADINFEMADHMRTKPDIDSLTLEGVNLTLKDVNLTLPS
jgi:hypothetical protein